jgi:hypothetical protein
MYPHYDTVYLPQSAITSRFCADTSPLVASPHVPYSPDGHHSRRRPHTPYVVAGYDLERYTEPNCEFTRRIQSRGDDKRRANYI